METKNNVDLQLAAHLANPFMLPGQSGQPLSFRVLQDGGMVVIAHDGRKMWFTALEVCRARKEMNLPEVRVNHDPAKKVLTDLDPRKTISSRPPAGTREGYSECISLPPDLKFIEEMVHANASRYKNPRKKRA